MKIHSLSHLKKKIIEIGKLIEAPKECLILDTRPNGFGKPHLEINSQEYNFVSSERGTEFERLITSDINELLYWVFRTVTFEMAMVHMNSRIEIRQKILGGLYLKNN